jgi:hypothetical protein
VAKGRDEGKRHSDLLRQESPIRIVLVPLCSPTKGFSSWFLVDVV